MNRVIRPELLDELPVGDPRAIASRRDLARLNRLMGNAGCIARHLSEASPKMHGELNLVDLGSGDGRLLLSAAVRSRHLGPVHAVLLDRRPSLDQGTMRGFQALGWTIRVLASDVFEWIRGQSTSGQPAQVVLANLFTHHFTNAELRTLFLGLAQCARLFIAVEPKRSWFSFAMAQMLGLIGCCDVTRHDAPVSVRAGFARKELSRLWPVDSGWVLEERDSGWFSHVFVAAQNPRPGS